MPRCLADTTIKWNLGGGGISDWFQMRSNIQLPRLAPTTYEEPKRFTLGVGETEAALPLGMRARKDN